MATAMIQALLKTNPKFNAFAQTQAGQDFILEADTAIGLAQDATERSNTNPDGRWEAKQALATEMLAAEARVANALTAIGMMLR